LPGVAGSVTLFTDGEHPDAGAHLSPIGDALPVLAGLLRAAEAASC